MTSTAAGSNLSEPPSRTSGPPAVWWPPAKRIGFRFAVLYLALHSVTSLTLGGLPQRVATPVVTWVAWHVFGVVATPAVSGSGDRTFDWVLTFVVLVIAVAGTAVWSAMDRRRDAYQSLDRRFRVFLRFVLGWHLISYGAFKVIPVQMPAPMLTRLLEPFGQFSPMGVLWASIGASLPYERFLGSVELAAGILLFIPRTALLGALVALGAILQVFVLNMTYDVPVKLFSFHLLLCSLFLLAPAARQFANGVFARGGGARWAAVAQIMAGVALTVQILHGAAQSWTRFGGGAPHPPLYGIWTIDRMRIDGAERSSLTRTDWRQIVIQNDRTIVFWQWDDTPVAVGAGYDMTARTIALHGEKLTFERPDASHLVFDGRLYDHVVHIETTRLDERTLPLTSGGFHWIQEFPLNR